MMLGVTDRLPAVRGAPPLILSFLSHRLFLPPVSHTLAAPPSEPLSQAFPASLELASNALVGPRPLF